MLGGVGECLDGAWAARLGLAHEIRALVASCNMVAFREAPQPARLRVVSSIADATQLLRDKPAAFDPDATTADACAQFLLEAEKVAPHAALSAADHLLLMLLRQWKDPVF